MKKVLLILVILTIAATSVFALVACGPKDPAVTGAPNDFMAKIKDAEDITFYLYDFNGDVITEIAKNKNGELYVNMGEIKAYAVLENEELVVYSLVEGVWYKTKKTASIKQYLDVLNNALKAINAEAKMVKGEDDLWFYEADSAKKEGYKLDGEMLLGYGKEKTIYVKKMGIELKATIQLPEEAKDAIESII